MMFFSFPKHQELPEKEKPPTHQGGGFNSPAEILFSEFSSPHIDGNFDSRQAP
jgi:hypothetical protein